MKRFILEERERNDKFSQIVMIYSLLEEPERENKFKLNQLLFITLLMPLRMMVKS